MGDSPVPGGDGRLWSRWTARLRRCLGVVMACYVGGGAAVFVARVAAALLTSEAKRVLPGAVAIVAGLLGVFLLPIVAGGCYLAAMLAHLFAARVLGTPVARLA